MFSVLFAAAIAAGQPQPNCENPQTQTDMNICSRRAYEAADAVMTRQYSTAAARMKQMDMEAEPGYFAALLQSQRAWLKFRDAQCRLEGYVTRGGSAEWLNENMCLLDLTQKRTDELKSFLEAF